MATKPIVSIYNEHNSSWFHIGGDTPNIPAPSDYNGIATTVVDSARNTKAQFIGDVIASDIAKVELRWNFLTVAQYASLAQLFEEKYNGNFVVPVVFFDIVKGDWDGDSSQAPSSTNNVRLFYCGDRKASVAKIKLDPNGKPIGYTGVQLNLIDTGMKYV